MTQKVSAQQINIINYNGYSVKWGFLDSPLSANSVLLETEKKQIAILVNDGNTEGVIKSDGNNIWWELINWQDIAQKLYEAVLTNDACKIETAIEYFEEYTN